MLFVLPAFFKKSSSSGPSQKSLAQITTDAAALVETAELKFRAEHGTYAAQVADLITVAPKLGDALVSGVRITLDTSTDGAAYVATTESSVLRLVRAHDGTKLISHGCLVLKSGSGIACPAADQPATKTTATTTTGTTTTTTTGGGS